MSVKLEKVRLTDNVLFRYSLNAAFQRNKIYKRKAKKEEEKEFKEFLKSYLETWLNKVVENKKYGDAHHYRAVSSLSRIISKKFAHILSRNSFNIGTSQKLLNVYWKANWVFKNDVKEPIHCPFDGIIIKRLSGDTKGIKWTKMKKIEDYKLLVNAAKNMCKGYSIAKWELIEYNKLGLLV